jgi:hypothetical protein
MKVRSALIATSNSNEFREKLKELNELGFHTINFQVASQIDDVPKLYALLEQELPQPEQRARDKFPS